jgi:hypothetical protein
MYSDTIGEQLAAALADLQTQLPHIAKVKTAKVKTKTGADYEYKYENLGQISHDLLPLLGKLGLSWVTRPTVNERAEFVLAYTLQHISGEAICGEYPLQKGSPQEMGSAITYARRYCLCAVTGVAPDDDDDDGAAAMAASRRRRSQPKPEQVSDGPTGITGDQMAKMQALFTERGMGDDKLGKLKYAREAIGGRAIESSTELTKVEASKVIAKLTSWAAQETPPADGAVA